MISSNNEIVSHSKCDEGKFLSGIIAKYRFPSCELEYYGDVDCGKAIRIWFLVVVILVYFNHEQWHGIGCCLWAGKVYIGEFMNGHLHNDGYMYDIRNGDLRLTYRKSDRSAIIYNGEPQTVKI